ncbi:MAG TPA: hypothetical protein VM692_04690, partial [Gammaproteobacteria bacterium]|nr:hypothetical protein [Gammaproteobacteria bacterium]
FACPTGTPSCKPLTQLDGPPAAPEAAKADQFVVVDLDNVNADCWHSVGAAGFGVELAAGQLVRPVPEPQWKADNNKPTTIDGVLDIGSHAGELQSPDPNYLRFRVGYVPSDQMPVFTSAPGPDLQLPSTPMLELLSCTFGAQPPVVAPTDLENRFPALAHAEAGYVQTLSGGAKLANGVAATAVINKGANYNASVSSTAPFAGSMKVGGIDLPFRGVRVGVAASALTELTFTPASDAADYYDVLLHEITGNSKQLLRVYTIPNGMLAAPVTVDLRAITLTPGREYVFEVRSYTGRQTARTGNFELVQERQSLAVVHSATFVVE